MQGVAPGPFVLHFSVITIAIFNSGCSTITNSFFHGRSLPFTVGFSCTQWCIARNFFCTHHLLNISDCRLNPLLSHLSQHCFISPKPNSQVYSFSVMLPHHHQQLSFFLLTCSTHQLAQKKAPKATHICFQIHCRYIK